MNIEVVYVVIFCTVVSWWLISIMLRSNKNAFIGISVVFMLAFLIEMIVLFTSVKDEPMASEEVPIAEQPDIDSLTQRIDSMKDKIEEIRKEKDEVVQRIDSADTDSLLILFRQYVSGDGFGKDK